MGSHQLLCLRILSTDKGLINILLSNFGVEPINWYSEPKYWPFIIVLRVYGKA